MSLSLDLQAERGGFALQARFDSSARVVAVQGPSGAGKTTLLHAVAGLIPVTRARVLANADTLVDTDAGLSPPPHRRGVGYVFQDVRLFPHLSVGANIAFGGRFAARPADVEPLIDLLDLRPLLSRWTRNLSGGEARRVALARALATAPRLLLLDEPFAGLDARRRDELMPYLIALRDHTALPMLLVSHDPRDADALAQDRVEIVEGRLVQEPLHSNPDQTPP